MRNEPKQQRALIRIEQILDAASAVFCEFGYDNATTNEIARRANTSIGAVYRFFPDKKAIFVALANRYLDKGSKLIASDILPKLSLDARELAGAALDLWDSFLASEPTFAAVFVYADGSPELKEIDRTLKRNASKILAGLFIQRSKKKLSQVQSEIMARICVELSAAYFRLCLSEPDMPHLVRKKMFQDLLTVILHDAESKSHFAS